MTVAGLVLAALAGYLLITAAVLWLMHRAESSPYLPEAAEAPDPVATAYEETGDTFGWQRAQPYTHPHIVAGSDLDRCVKRDQRLIDLRFRLLVDTDPGLSALPTEAAGLLAYEVAPEVDR